MSKLVCVAFQWTRPFEYKCFGQALRDMILQNQNYMKLYRIIIDILLVFLVFLLPSYLTFIFLIILLFTFNNFVEAVFVAFVLDSLYGVKSLVIQNSHSFNNLLIDFIYSHKFLFIILIIFIISFKLKKVLKFYSKDKI